MLVEICSFLGFIFSVLDHGDVDGDLKYIQNQLFRLFGRGTEVPMFIKNRYITINNNDEYFALYKNPDFPIYFIYTVLCAQWELRAQIWRDFGFHFEVSFRYLGLGV